MRDLMHVCSYSDSKVTAAKSSKYIFKVPAKHVLVSYEDSDVQFPDPYIVPRHFSQDVIEALTNGRMNTETQNGFLSGVASHVFQIKRKPSPEDMINVSRAIITKYPFMRSPTGSPYVSIIHQKL